MFLRYGVSRRTQQRYFIRDLTNSKKDLRASLELQKKIVSSFTEEEKTFLHLQSEEGFKARRTYPRAVTLGVFMYSESEKKEILVAQQTIEFNADTDIQLPEEIKKENAKIATLEGFMVHPEYRGNGFTEILLDHSCHIGKTQGKDIFVSCVDAANPFSYGVLLKNGFGVASAYVDPEDNGKTYAFVSMENKNNSCIWYPKNRAELGTIGFEGVQERLMRTTYVSKNPFVFLWEGASSLAYS